MEAENPDWAGNSKVRYWTEEWRQMVFEYTDRLIAAGVNGAYLDIIDAYQYFAERGSQDEGDDSPAQRMADLVSDIAAYARNKDPGFLIFPQNAPELAGMVPEYLDHVDGIGQEDIYYGYDGDGVATPGEVTAEMERHLDWFRERGKLVLTVDYTSSPNDIAEAYSRSTQKGYVPFVTTRELDRLNINPDHEPD